MYIIKKFIYVSKECIVRCIIMKTFTYINFVNKVHENIKKKFEYYRFR